MTKSILLVEDETIVRESLKDWLTEEGYEVTATEDGEKALEIIGKQEFGIVVLDLKLPGKDGIQILKEAREQVPTLRAVIITAYPSVETAVEATRAGAMDYLVKPFPPESLEQLIREALEVTPTVAPETIIEKKKQEVGKLEGKIATHLYLGQDFFKRGDYEAAIKEFEKVLEIAPGNLEARVWIRKAKMGGAAPTVEVAEEEVVEEVGKPKPCVWMKMGVVSYRMCTKDYDCLTCEFDQQMQAASESPEIVAALERLKRLPGNQRLCRYVLRDEISYRLCTHLFECVNCEFYQLMEEARERKLAKLSARREALRKKQAKS